MHRTALVAATLLSAAVSAPQAQAARIAFAKADFAETNVFNRLRSWSFDIDLTGPLVAGQSYAATDVALVRYDVYGILDSPTPSGFPAFDLRRTITGPDFIAQGSSLSLTIRPDADLSDGLQAGELAGSGADTVFRFYGVEIGTGRYHPADLVLRADGTGRLQNADNRGGINPGSREEVDVDFGDEYIVDLAFDPAALTLAAVPVPGGLVLLLSAGAALAALQRRS
jgi:hypothetical protein